MPGSASKSLLTRCEGRPAESLGINSSDKNRKLKSCQTAKTGFLLLLLLSLDGLVQIWLTPSRRCLHKTAAFYTEQCTTPSLFGYFEVLTSRSDDGPPTSILWRFVYYLFGGRLGPSFSTTRPAARYQRFRGEWQRLVSLASPCLFLRCLKSSVRCLATSRTTHLGSSLCCRRWSTPWQFFWRSKNYKPMFIVPVLLKQTVSHTDVAS